MTSTIKKAVSDHTFYKAIRILKHLYKGGQIMTKDGQTIAMGEDFSIGTVLFREENTMLIPLGVANDFTFKDLCEMIESKSFYGIKEDSLRTTHANPPK